MKLLSTLLSGELSDRGRLIVLLLVIIAVSVLKIAGGPNLLQNDIDTIWSVLRFLGG